MPREGPLLVGLRMVTLRAEVGMEIIGVVFVVALAVFFAYLVWSIVVQGRPGKGSTAPKSSRGPSLHLHHAGSVHVHYAGSVHETHIHDSSGATQPHHAMTNFAACENSVVDAAPSDVAGCSPAAMDIGSSNHDAGTTCDAIASASSYNVETIVGSCTPSADFTCSSSVDTSFDGGSGIDAGGFGGSDLP